MFPTVWPFSDEQQRVLVNLHQHYEVWMAASRALHELPYGLKWQRRGAREYLYEVLDRTGNAKSLGPRSAETEAKFDAYHQDKEALKARAVASETRLGETCRLYRVLRLPMIASPAAEIIRETDRRGHLGSHLMIVGTNCMPAYAIEAGGLIQDAPAETDDFDMAWTGVAGANDIAPDEMPIWSILKAVDQTYTINTERTFQARNKSAYEVEVLVAPSRAAGMTPRDRPSPVPMPEQEWLLNGQTIEHVVTGRDASPARLVVPDPRWFALQKLWLAEKPDRNALKKPKDRAQGTALLNAIAEAMPRFPLDAAFEAELPSELVPHYERWRDSRAHERTPWAPG